MSNVLLDYLMANPGKADYMDLNSGTVVHTGGYGKCFGAIPTSNIYTGETGVIVMNETSHTNNYNVSELASFIDEFYKEKANVFFCFAGCNEDKSGNCFGAVNYNDQVFNFNTSDMDALSGLVNNKTPEQLIRCLETCNIIECPNDLRMKSKLLLYICAGF